MVRIGLGQFTASSDREHNLAEIERLVAEASHQQVGVICFHELASTTYFCFKNDPAFRQLAEPEDGESVTRVREAARNNEVAVVFPFYERDPDGRLFNTAVVIDAQGQLVGKYRKMSIPAILQTVNSTETPADEQYYFTPGDLGFPVFKVAGLTVGILICYDRHLTEAARTLGIRGADIVFVPTATYRDWIRRVWEAELIGHAIANNYYVAGVNRVGVEAGGAANRSYFGSSVVIDPTGQIMRRASDNASELISVDISPERAHELRELWGFYRCRRPDAYGLLSEPIPQREPWVITASSAEHSAS